MDYRVEIAIGLIAAMLLVSVVVIVRRMNAKRAFEYRQQGRGKSNED